MTRTKYLLNTKNVYEATNGMDPSKDGVLQW